MFFEIVDKDAVFWFAALTGSGMFVIQFFLTFLGTGTEEMDDGSLLDAGRFKWMTKQAITGFVMMFGWVGLTCTKEFGLSKLLSALIAILAGAASMVIIGYVYKIAKKLRSTGDVFKIEDAIGKEATVYQSIAKDKIGKISLTLYNMTHEIDAISLTGEELLSFTLVQVVNKADERTVVVVPKK